jgi:integrase
MITRQRFNEKLIRQIPFAIGNKPDVWGDTEQPNLHLHAGKTKKTYRHVECTKTKRINDAIADASQIKVSEARRIILERKLALANNKFQHKSSLTVNQALDSELVPYYSNCVKDSKSAFSSIARFARKYFGEMLVTDVDPDLAQSKVFELIAEGKAPETIRKLVLYPKKLYKKLIKRGVVVVNPFDDLELPKVSNIRNVTLSPEQRPDWFKCCVAENSVGADAILIELLLALRVNEAISIKVSDISSDYKTLTLSKTKAGKKQQVSLDSMSQEILKRRVLTTSNEFVFDSSRKPEGHISSPRGAFANIKKRMATLGHDVSNLTQHDLRRTNATVCAEVTGGDVHMVAKHIRHATPSILHRYVHYQSDAVAAVSEATAQALINPKQNEEK